MPLTLQPPSSCPLPPDPLNFFFLKKKKDEGFLRSRGGAVGVLADWFCCLRFCFDCLVRYSAQRGLPWRRWAMTPGSSGTRLSSFFVASAFRPVWPGRCIWALSVYRSRLAPWTRGESNHGKLSALRPLGHGRYRFATASAKWHSTFLTVLRHSWICRRQRIG